MAVCEACREVGRVACTCSHASTSYTRTDYTPLYADRDELALGALYRDLLMAHMFAMTHENLYRKSAIAHELAYRDLRIKQLEGGVQEDVLDSLDWTRLMQGERRALKEEHQPLFDQVWAAREKGGSEGKA